MALSSAMMLTKSLLLYSSFQVESTDGMTGLYRMNIDGTQIETIAIGNITNIHCTSKYTFFQYYEDQGVLYRVSTSGADTSVEQITIK